VKYFRRKIVYTVDDYSSKKYETALFSIRARLRTESLTLGFIRRWVAPHLLFHSIFIPFHQQILFSSSWFFRVYSLGDCFRTRNIKCIIYFKFECTLGSVTILIFIYLCVLKFYFIQHHTYRVLVFSLLCEWVSIPF
jgi:hypothetical protein